MWPFRRKPRAAPQPAPEPAPAPAEKPALEAPRTKTADDVLRQLAVEAAAPRAARADANLGRCLLAEGPLSREFLERQLAVGGKADSYLGRVLAQTHAPAESDLFDVLTRDYQIPDVDLKKCKVHVAAARSLPREIALKYKIVPIDRIGDLLCIVFSEKPNPNAIEAVRRATGLRVKALRCPPHHILMLLRRLYPTGVAAAAKATAAILISEEEYRRLADGPAARAEARWESLHASRGPIRAARFAKR